MKLGAASPFEISKLIALRAIRSNTIFSVATDCSLFAVMTIPSRPLKPPATADSQRVVGPVTSSSIFALLYGPSYSNGTVATP